MKSASIGWMSLTSCIAIVGIWQVCKGESSRERAREAVEAAAGHEADATPQSAEALSGAEAAAEWVPLFLCYSLLNF